MADWVVVEHPSTKEKDEDYKRTLVSIFKSLRSQAISNMEYFQEGKSRYDADYHRHFCLLYEHLDLGIEPMVLDLMQVAHEYDFGNIRANGYRSMIKIVQKCCVHLLQLSRHISVNRTSFLFRSGHYVKELESYANLLGQLRACLFYVAKLGSYCKPGKLFAEEEWASEPEAEQHMLDVESLAQECFYGRTLAFQFCESMMKPLSFVVIAMASFSEGYQHGSSMMKFASALLSSGKYALSPVLRSQQVAYITRHYDINFFKSFWLLAENDMLNMFPSYMCPPITVDEVMKIEASEPLQLPHSEGQGKMVTVRPPASSDGDVNIMGRLMSHELRTGMEDVHVATSSPKQGTEPIVLPKSPYLVIQCHGGGFVAQSSKSHQVYLRHWVKDLKVPTFCIDYSLAPEHPFPRQLEECYYAYAWILKNCHSLGCTGERIVCVGDSAGGNLMIAMALKCAQEGLRVPDGIVTAYGCVMVRATPSPSRILTVMDPLLPMGILGRCLAAYAGMKVDLNGVNPPPSTNGTASSPPARPAKKKLHRLGSQDSGYTSTQINSGGSDHPSDCECLAKAGAATETASTAAAADAAKVDHETANEGWMTPAESTAKETPFLQKKNSAETVKGKEQVHVTAQNGDLGIGGEEEQEKDDVNDEEFHNASTTLRQRNKSQPDKSKLSLDLESVHSALPDHKASPTKRGRKTHARTESIPVFIRPSEDHELFGQTSGPPKNYAQMRHYAQSPLTQYRHLPIQKDPFMSPMLATDDMLKGMPPVYMVACHLDPIVDDSVQFCKRLDSLGREAHLDVFDDLPHGFLNFVMFSKEAKSASDLVVRRLRQALKMPGSTDGSPIG